MPDPDPFKEIDYFCTPFTPPILEITLATTIWVIVFVYLVCFLIGCHNIVVVLIKQKYYKSAYLNL